MKYKDLSLDARNSIDELIEVFGIKKLLYLDKIQMGENIAKLIDMTGQDGKGFVNFVYEYSVKENPAAILYPPELWLLTSFLSTLCKSCLRNHGYGSISDPYQFHELARDIVELLDPSPVEEDEEEINKQHESIDNISTSTRDEKGAVSLLNSGIDEKRNGNYTLAIYNYKRAGKLDPYNPNVYYNQGKTYYLMRNFLESFRNYMKSIYMFITLNDMKLDTDSSFVMQAQLLVVSAYRPLPVKQVPYERLHKILLGDNLANHIAHSCLDKELDSFSTHQKNYVNQYSNILAGNSFVGDEEQYQDIKKNYTEAGYDIMDRYVNWNHIKTLDFTDSIQILKQCDNFIF